LGACVAAVAAPLAVAKAMTEPRDKLPEADYDNDYRHIAMKGPLVFSAWGYDLEGRPNKMPEDVPLPPGWGYEYHVYPRGSGGPPWRMPIGSPEIEDFRQFGSDIEIHITDNPPKEPEMLPWLLEDVKELKFNDESKVWEVVEPVPNFVPYIIPNNGYPQP